MDTNAYAAFKQGDADAVQVLQHAPHILIPTTVLGELLGGFAAGSRERANRSELSRFLQSPRVRTVSCSDSTADFYALVYSALRRKGKPIPTNDMWIAASCLEHGAALFTLDAHFAQVGGLRIGRRLDEFVP